MIHVVTSEGARRALQRANIAGDIVVWRDRLDEGPVLFPGASLENWIQARARFMETMTRGQISGADAFSLLDAVFSKILRGLSEDEVVFWADAGLADQLALLCFLNLSDDMAKLSRRHAVVSSNERAGGRLCALNDLIPSQIKSLFESRRAVSEAIFHVARKAWRAFCDTEPRALLKLLDEDLSPLPHLKAALIRHLQQYPDTAHGLSRLEYEALAIVGMGYSKLVEIFVHVDQHEDRPHFTDVALWRCLDRLAREKNPLVSVSGEAALPLWNAPRRLLEWTIWITDIGLEVLHGQRDRVRLNGFERQLGGVRLEGALAKWRWDADSGTLVSAEHAN